MNTTLPDLTCSETAVEEFDMSQSDRRRACKAVTLVLALTIFASLGMHDLRAAPKPETLKILLEGCGTLLLRLPADWSHRIVPSPGQATSCSIQFRPEDEKDRSFEAYIDLDWKVNGKRLYFKSNEWMPKDALAQIKRAIPAPPVIKIGNGHVRGQAVFWDSKHESRIERSPDNPSSVTVSYRYSTELWATVGWSRVRVKGCIATFERAPKRHKELLRLIETAEFRPIVRTWHFVSGKSVKAALRSVGTKTVTLMTVNGKRLKTRRRLLSAKDLAYVDEIIANNPAIKD